MLAFLGALLFSTLDIYPPPIPYVIIVINVLSEAMRSRGNQWGVDHSTRNSFDIDVKFHHDWKTFPHFGKFFADVSSMEPQPMSCPSNHGASPPRGVSASPNLTYSPWASRGQNTIFFPPRCWAAHLPFCNFLFL